MFSGKKTYLVALLMVAYSVGGYLLGKAPELDWTAVLEGFGLATLRAGIASK